MAAEAVGERLFFELLDQHLVHGRVRFLLKGREVVTGKGDELCTLEVLRDRFFSRVLGQGNLGLGEAYMDRDFEIRAGQLQDFLIALLKSGIDRKIKADLRLLARVAAIYASNLLRGNARNVRAHYDIGDELFECFLDSTLTYSCGYAKTPTDSLDELQQNKLDRICQKLELRPGDRLLDIGCGFGGLLIHAAKHYGAVGTGITISYRHCERGKLNAERAGVADKVRIELRDHRSVQSESYDKVVSVGMMEHLPRGEYDTYFKNIARVLTREGRGLVHAIGCSSAKNEHDPFIQKYIFPGSNQPRLSEMALGVERQSMLILDVENMARHYAFTCKGWLEKFRQNSERLDPKKYDDAFRRMWEYYLYCGIAAATASDSTLYQVLFARDYAAPVRLHRV